MNIKKLTGFLKKAAPIFVPPVIVGGATIGLIFAANAFGNGQQAALAAGFASLYKTHRTNEDDMLNSANGGDEPKGVLTFYEPISKRYFQRTMEEVIEAEYRTNRNFILRGHAPLNEFSEFLGLEKTDDGEKLGWSGEALWDLFDAAWIDFYHDFKTKGELLPPRQITDSLHKAGDMRYVEMDVENQTFAECDCYVSQMPFEPMDNYLNYPFDD